MLSADFTINRKNNKIDLLRFGRNTRKSRKSAITFEINYNMKFKFYKDKSVLKMEKMNLPKESKKIFFFT